MTVYNALQIAFENKGLANTTSISNDNFYVGAISNQLAVCDDFDFNKLAIVCDLLILNGYEKIIEIRNNHDGKILIRVK